MPPTIYHDPLTDLYPQYPPRNHTRSMWAEGNRTHIRLSPLALDNLLHTAHDLWYIRKPTRDAQDTHRYLSVFVNYAIAAQPGTYPFMDTRPPHIRAQDLTLIQANQPLPWSYELPAHEKISVNLRIHPLTFSWFHLTTQLHLISIPGHRYAQQRIPKRAVAGTIAVILEAIGLGWLTPSHPFPQAPEFLYPAPFKHPAPPTTEMEF